MLRKLVFLVPAETCLVGGAGIVEALGFSLPLWAWCAITGAGAITFIGVWWGDHFLRLVPGDSWLGRLQFWWGWKKGKWQERRKLRKDRRDLEREKKRRGGRK